MRTLALAAITMVTAFGASSADAQRLGRAFPGAPYPVPGQTQGQTMPQPPLGMQQGQPVRTQSRWGRTVGGRWYGGVNAPGGWSAYRRPSRGYRVPRYWTGASFFIGDFAQYGLSAPPPGYRWYRYYDDAVLIDDRGRVYDSVGGLDWDGGAYGGTGGYASDGYGYAQGGPGGAYAQHDQQQFVQPLPPVTHNGAVTTYSTSSGYSAQDGYGYAEGGYPQPRGGYASGGYYYPSQSTTVVTVQSAPTVTTTTTEYVEETTTGTRYRKRYVAPRRMYHPVVRRACGCTRVVKTRVIYRRPRVHAPAVEETIQGS